MLWQKHRFDTVRVRRNEGSDRLKQPINPPPITGNLNTERSCRLIIHRILRVIQRRMLRLYHSLPIRLEALPSPPDVPIAVHPLSSLSRGPDVRFLLIGMLLGVGGAL